MNTLDFFNSKALSDIDIINMMQQFKHLRLAFESIKSMCDEKVIALPIHMDEKYIYWCTTDDRRIFVITTSYETRNAGDGVTLTAQKIQHASIRSILRERLGKLFHDDEIVYKVNKLKEQVDNINIPSDIKTWLREARLAI